MKRKNQKIVAVRKDNVGRIIEFKTDVGQVFNYEMAKEAIDLNIIENASCYASSEGIRKIMLKRKDQQIDNLPEF